MIDPVNNFKIPEEWIVRTGLPREELEKKVASGMIVEEYSEVFYYKCIDVKIRKEHNHLQDKPNLFYDFSYCLIKVMT
jgi:hypothetical protein